VRGKRMGEEKWYSSEIGNDAVDFKWGEKIEVG